MGVFQNRPLAFACAFSALLATGAAFVPWPVRLPLCLALFAATVGTVVPAVVRRRCGPKQTVALLSFLLGAVLLFGSWRFFDLQAGDLARSAGREVTAEGVITARDDSGFRTSFAVSLDELDGKRTGRRVCLMYAGTSALRVGDRVRFTGTVAPLEKNGGAFRSADGFSGAILADADGTTLLSEGHFSLWTRLSVWNDALSERLSERIGGAEGGLAAALLLGNRSHLAGGDALAFRRAGVSHLLALSGLHVGILIAALDRFLRLCRVPRAFRVAPVILLSFVYLAVTGASPSTVRAVLMASLLYLSFVARRSYDPVTALFTALFLILAAEPYAVTDLGLWFSFAAAGGIVVFLPAVNRLFDRRGRAPYGFRRFASRTLKTVFLAVAVGLFAFCATLPLTALTFGEVSVLSVPVTLLLSPVLPFALVLPALALVFPLPPLTFAAGKVLALLRAVVAFSSARPGVTVLLDDPRPLVFVLLTAAALLFCAVVALRRRWRLLLALPVLFAVCSLVSAYAVVPSAGRGVGLTYRSAGSREYLLFTRGSGAVAVDLSGGNYAYDLKADLNANGCTELKELILTHYDPAVTHLLDRVAATVRLGGICLPDPRDADEEAVAARVREEADRLGVRVRTGDGTEPLPGLSLRVSHDPGGSGRAVTVFAATGDRAVVWYDLRDRSPEQTVFLAEALSRADVVILGRHGTKPSAVADLSGKPAASVWCADEAIGVVGLPEGAVLTRFAEGSVNCLLR